MEELKSVKTINGWGADADKSLRPAHKMWEIPLDGTGAHWESPDQQPGFKDFVSVERPRVTLVFGNTVPPKGLSGLVRRIAFKKSEGTFSHWMLLIFADRIGIVEGYLDDFRHGVVPHPLRERGWNMDKKFKTRRYYKVMALSGLVTVGLIATLVNLAAPRSSHR